MHIHNLDRWTHQHNFSVDNIKGERRTKIVFALTFITMIIEIVAGMMYGSMALLADGWHMSTHTAAFLITLFAYQYAREHAQSSRYAFGTGKVNVLGGFASAIALATVALFMILESSERFFNPQEIHFNESIMVAIFGLSINLLSALLLKDHHHDHHSHHHSHETHEHHHEDHNLRAAYIHVLADALTSFLAIFALLAGKLYAYHWLDPVMGIVGGLVIIRWSYALLQQTSPILLDATIDKKLKQEIIETLEQDKDNRVVDLHVWKVGAKDYAAIISLVTHFPQDIEHYKNLLEHFHEISHVTFEVNVCHEQPCLV